MEHALRAAWVRDGDGGGGHRRWRRRRLAGRGQAADRMRAAARATVLLAAALALAVVLAHLEKVLSLARQLSAAEVRALALVTTERHFPHLDPLMLQAIAVTETRNDPAATRYEPRLRDVSVGLMQTLVSTAVWLAQDKGYGAYGVPSPRDLYRPEVSMYFGAAYLDYLQRFQGEPRSEEWVVRAYNGGPGAAASAATLMYWQRYQHAKMQLGE
jgi:soluble lytic murein transglycosylase-like protein